VTDGIEQAVDKRATHSPAVESRVAAADMRVKLGVTALTVVWAAAMSGRCGLRFTFADVCGWGGLLVGLSVVALYYQRRRQARFSTTIQVLIHLVAFCPSFVVLMYAIAATGHPLVDPELTRFDAALGYHVSAVVGWVRAHPTANISFTAAYVTLMPQTLLAIIVLGLFGDGIALRKFILRFMACALITAGLFLWFPAAGPFTIQGYQPTSAQTHYLTHFRAMRDGATLTLRWKEVEGLITFPSFHATWAVLLALAYWKRRLLFPLFAALNAIVVVSTLTTGWHYLIDVLSGIAVSLLAFVLLRPLEKWLYSPPNTP
jgi:membrane-associated phospholipid phosphatase